MAVEPLDAVEVVGALRSAVGLDDAVLAAVLAERFGVCKALVTHIAGVGFGTTMSSQQVGGQTLPPLASLCVF